MRDIIYMIRINRREGIEMFKQFIAGKSALRDRSLFIPGVGTEEKRKHCKFFIYPTSTLVKIMFTQPMCYCTSYNN